MDVNVLPTVYALTVFVCCFRPLVRRAGPHTNIWFVGWACLLPHFVALLFPAGTGLHASLRGLLVFWPLEFCGLAFLWAACNAQARRSNRLIIMEIGLPILLQTGFYAFHTASPSLRLSISLFFFVPAAHLFFWPQHRSGALTHVAAAFAALAMGLALFNNAAPVLVLNVILCALFLSVAYVTLVSANRATRGVALMVTGLAIWAISYLLPFFDLGQQGILLARPILDFPKYLVAAGTILSFLDEYVGKTESLALHDPLTGLPNRRLFENRLDEAIAESRRTHTPVACFVIDVDNFKYINDTFGHPVGDGLLQALAKRLSWNLGPRDMLARTGGDEFTAVLVEAADEYHIRFIAGAMMAAGCVPVSIQHHSIDIRISVGIAVSPQDAGDSSELHKAADDAMYRAKRQGGSVVAFASEESSPIHVS